MSSCRVGRRSSECLIFLWQTGPLHRSRRGIPEDLKNTNHQYSTKPTSTAILCYFPFPKEDELGSDFCRHIWWMDQNRGFTPADATESAKPKSRAESQLRAHLAQPVKFSIQIMSLLLLLLALPVPSLGETLNCFSSKTILLCHFMSCISGVGAKVSSDCLFPTNLRDLWLDPNSNSTLRWQSDQNEKGKTLCLKAKIFLPLVLAIQIIWEMNAKHTQV